MRRPLAGSMALAGMIAIGGTVLAGPERFEDPQGDVVGDAPDIVAVSVSEPEGEPTIRFQTEFAPERPFGSDEETFTDVIFVIFSDESSVDDRGILVGGWTVGAHGVNLEEHKDGGSFLVTDDDLWWRVVDVDSDEHTVTFTFDRKLIDSPDELYWQVLVGTERFSAEEGQDEEGDSYPEPGEPPAHYELSAIDR